MHHAIRLAALALAVAVAGCGSSAADPAVGSVAVGAAVPEFSLLDVNPASPTAQELVSPSDYAKRVSAWYFGHST